MRGGDPHSTTSPPWSGGSFRSETPASLPPAPITWCKRRHKSPPRVPGQKQVMDPQTLSRRRGARANRLDGCRGPARPGDPRAARAAPQGRRSPPAPSSREAPASAGRAPPRGCGCGQGERRPQPTPPPPSIKKMQEKKQNETTSLTDVSGHCGQAPGELLGSRVFG